MHGDHRAAADELVQFDVVDVAARAELGGVEDDEDVVSVGPDLGHGVALDTRLDRQGVEAEHLPQHPGGLLVADGDVDPDQPVVPGQQLLQLFDRMLLDAGIGHEANVHPARHLLGAVVPAPVWRRRDRAGSAAGWSTQRIVVGPDNSSQRAGGSDLRGSAPLVYHGASDSVRLSGWRL
jgi:hypothetical protein